MFRRRFAALLLAALPVACTAQIATPHPTTPATPGTGAPAADSVPAPATPPVAATPAAPKITYTACNVDEPYIAMTFDDGPHAQLTPRLLDILKERNIKATFFLVGQNAAEYPQIVKRIVAEGHEVASHSWSHPLLSKMSDASVNEQLRKTHDAIKNASGVEPTTMRPPYGGFTERQRRWCFGEFGYKVILWDVDPLDWKVRNAAHVQREILAHTRPGSIVLSHDIHKSTVDAMPPTLDALQAKGFKFATVSELLAMDRPLPPKPKATPKAKGTTKAAPGAPVKPGTTEAPTAPATEAPVPPAPESTPAVEPAPSVPAPAPAAEVPAPASAPAPAPAPARTIGR